jgi:hypothetical protein
MEDQDINSQYSVFHAVSGRDHHMAIEDQDINSQNSVFHMLCQVESIWLGDYSQQSEFCLSCCVR